MVHGAERVAMWGAGMGWLTKYSDVLSIVPNRHEPPHSQTQGQGKEEGGVSDTGGREGRVVLVTWEHASNLKVTDDISSTITATLATIDICSLASWHASASCLAPVHHTPH